MWRKKRIVIFFFVLGISLLLFNQIGFSKTCDQISKEYGENLLKNGDFKKGLDNWSSQFAEIDKNILQSGNPSVKLDDQSPTKRMFLFYSLPGLVDFLNSGKEVYAEAWYYLEKEPENKEFGISALSLGPDYDFTIILLPERKIKVHSYSNGRRDIVIKNFYPLKEWFKLAFLYNKQSHSAKVYFNDVPTGTYSQDFMKEKLPYVIGLGGTYPDENTGILYVANAYCGTANPKQVETLTIEAENFVRYDEESISPPKILPMKLASGGKIIAVRRSDVGESTWAEYDFTLEKDGFYQVDLSTGGNSCSQAGYVSIDKGKDVFIEDRSCKEGEIISYPVASLELKKGKHSIRIRHCEKEGYSNAFVVDKIEIRLLEE